MKPLGDSNTHFWRMHRMARSTGTDLVLAFKTDDLPVQDYAAMLTACRGCAYPGRCDRILSQLPARADAPSFCANQQGFADLREAGHTRAR